MALVKRKRKTADDGRETKQKKLIANASQAPDGERKEVRLGKKKRRRSEAPASAHEDLDKESSPRRRKQELGKGKTKTKKKPRLAPAGEAGTALDDSRATKKKTKNKGKDKDKDKIKDKIKNKKILRRHEGRAAMEETSDDEKKPAVIAARESKTKKRKKEVQPDPQDDQSDNDSFFHGEKGKQAGAQESKAKVMERTWRDDGKLIHDYKVWVGNLPRNLSDEAVLADFAMFGQVLKLDMPRSKTGVLDGVAFIYYATEEAMNKALALDGKDYNGNTLRVKQAVPQNRAKKDKSAGDQGPATSECTVFIGGLPHDTSEDELRTTFSDCGEIESIRLPRGEDNKLRGFAFIVFTQLKAVRKALLQDGSEWRGRTIKVAKHSSKNTTPQGVDGRSQAPSQGSNLSANTVFVGSLPPDTSPEKLKTDFAECGAVEKVRLVQDSNGHFKGAAFVVFKNVAAAKKALEWNGQFFYGSRAIKVAPARQREQRET